MPRALTNMLFVLLWICAPKKPRARSHCLQSGSYLSSCVVGAITLFSPTSISQRNAGTYQFWPGVLYLCAGVLYLVACFLGYFISHYNILNSRDKKTKSVSRCLCLFHLLSLDYSQSCFLSYHRLLLLYL